MDNSKESKKGSVLRKWLFLLFGIVAIVALILFVVAPNLTKPLADRRGWITEAYFFPDADRPVALSALSHFTETTTSARQGSRTVRTWYSWLASIELTQGTRLARSEFEDKVDYNDDDPVRFLGHTDTFVWTISAGASLHGRDPYTAKIAVSNDEIKEANPEIVFPTFFEAVVLEDGGISNYAFDEISGGIIIETSEAELLLVDPDSLRASPISLDQTQPRVGIRRGPQARDTGQMRLRGEGIYFSGGSYPVRLNPEWSLYNAEFLVDETLSDNLKASRPESLFVTYDEDYSVEPARYLARVRMDGFPIWVTDLTTRVDIAYQHNGSVYAVAGGELFSVSTSDGAVHWAYRGSGDPAETADLPAPSDLPVQPDYVPPEPPPQLSLVDIVPGLLVLANFNEEGYFYPATVLGSAGADQFNIIYLDGSTEVVRAGAMIPDDLIPGAIVKVLITDDWIEGAVSHRSGVAVGVEFEHMSARWASMILIRRNPEWGVIVRLKGEQTEAPLNLSRFGDTSAYYFASIVERSNNSATMLYLDGTWEERALSDVV